MLRPTTLWSLITLVGSPSLTAASIGGMAGAWTGQAGTQAVAITTDVNIAGVINTLPLTVMGWSRLEASGSTHDDNPLVTVGTAGTAYSYYISAGGGHVNAYTDVSGWVDGSIVVGTATWFHWAVVFTSASVTVFTNGVANGSAGLGGNNALATTVYLGDRVDGVNASLNGQIADVRWYNRPCSSAEVWTAYVNPWDLYYVPGRRLYFDLAAAPASGYLLVAN